MQKKDLEDYRGLMLEIESLSHIKPAGRQVLIFYKDYRTGYGIPKMDIGIDEGQDMARELENKIKRKHNELLRKATAVEEWIESLADPVMRVIIRYYYVEGRSQQEIGDITGYSRERIGKKLQEFWAAYERRPQ